MTDILVSILLFAGSLFMLIASRALSGIMAGNISAAFAYVADVTTPENRGKGLGMIGAAFGLGFMLGPVIGGLLGGTHPETMDFALRAFVAAGVSALAAIGTWFFLPESLKQQDRRPWTAAGASPAAEGPADRGALAALRRVLLSPFAAVARSPPPGAAGPRRRTGPRSPGPRPSAGGR